ncbi:hypothetical protein I5G58_gp095 [Mycobacterium phage BirdsNest]|uniref:Uncharacterized protein n=1 Tax=Mycobacterium phage BirdsNest TaxID=2686231 RepID=A0A6B9L6R9_9CAUD|nr:hypothetical protein I5G58_gp095 [Mycobacterium phage BirdsNest]QHB37397.1 hypothetical protein PBI_BIRDSNEST_95 [Mycobacterium phage BirdsNest]
MGLPGLKLDINIKETVDRFLGLLEGMDSKLGELLEIEKRREERETAHVCGACDQVGRLACPTHGPVRVPTLDSQR